MRIPAGAAGYAHHHQAPLLRLASHHHEELEVNLVLSGSAAYLFEKERVALTPGSMIWLFPEQEHVLIDCSHDFSAWVLVFRPGLVEGHAAHASRQTLRCSDPGGILCRQLDAKTVDGLHFIYGSAALGGEELDFELANVALAHALVASWQAFHSSRVLIPWSDVHPAVARAARLISDSGQGIALPELARKAGLSPPRLSRLFKRQTGTSLTAFRQRKCLERFVSIHRSGARYSLIEAALLAGFGSYPQFHRVFRKNMGQSPAEYVRAIRSAR